MSKIVIIVKENNRQKYIFTVESENQKLNKPNIVKKRESMDYWI